MFRKLSGNLVVKLKAFVQAISTIRNSLAFGLFSDEFQTIQARNMAKLRLLTTTIAVLVIAGKAREKQPIRIYEVIPHSERKPLCTGINFGSFFQRNAPDH